MKAYRLLAAAIALFHTAAALAGGSIDMDDPRRVVGRENDVRIDAQLLQDTVTPGAPVGVTYQIQNFSKSPVAIADKVTTATYDSDTNTITLSIGAEVPEDGKMPHLVTIAPGEKKVFRTGATPVLSAAATRAALRAVPRFVQVKVSVLRDLEPFAKTRAAEVLPDALFEKWFEANDTIFLNTVPVRFAPRSSGAGGFVGADRRDASAM